MTPSASVTTVIVLKFKTNSHKHFNLYCRQIKNNLNYVHSWQRRPILKWYKMLSLSHFEWETKHFFNQLIVETSPISHSRCMCEVYFLPNVMRLWSNTHHYLPIIQSKLNLSPPSVQAMVSNTLRNVDIRYQTKLLSCMGKNRFVSRQTWICFSNRHH